MTRFPYRWAVLLLAFALLPHAGRAPAQPALLPSQVEASPAGSWKATNDGSGKVKGIVTIHEKNGRLDGTIETLFDPPVPHPTCYLCSGANKDQPVVGLQVLWGFHRNGDQWTGGQVLDPETGRVYRALLAVEDGGRRLRLRGYIGIPLLGRTEYWQPAR